ncbi:MAG: hypothetical protein UT24_C0033G0006 [Candidatus Woesebacteria bacterium GW2011_GWB1_39_12]|uniref:Uncharacterized protein n=1 Tax=Candidatus Woesebacteria bacterium GW2011_GWB1_39_12 TaxID=1618574 RepID=A0A0G0QAY3_9BACT|nr:MAG: hypothetical protein UT24_C0033G0006 [Candidatus Woesebacteria bacterium GW2011_GWB1_39_12]
MTIREMITALEAVAMIHKSDEILVKLGDVYLEGSFFTDIEEVTTKANDVFPAPIESNPDEVEVVIW